MRFNNIAFVICILTTCSIFAQTDSIENFPDFNKSQNNEERFGKLVEIDITKLKKGYWQAENEKSDSLYIKILDTKCYYYENQFSPNKAKMLAKLTRVTTTKPQTVTEKFIEIQFDYLDTLPEPRYSSELFYNTYGWEKLETYTFKKLLPNKLIIQGIDIPSKPLVFNKLSSEFPLFKEQQLYKLRSIEKKLTGTWKNKENERFILMGDSNIGMDNYLEEPIELSISTISFDAISKDSIKAQEQDLNIMCKGDSEFIMNIYPYERSRYRFELIDDYNFEMSIDSLNIREKYTKSITELFPDSIILRLKNRVWCDTIYNEFSNTTDTLMFDFGEISDNCDYNNSFLACKGYDYNMGLFHSSIFFDFAVFNNHYYFKKTTHGSISFWEVLSISANKLVIKKFDEGRTLKKELFLHPNNSDFFINGQRTRF